MSNQKQGVIKMSKLEKVMFAQKIIIEPFELRNTFPTNKLPFLNQNSIVIEMIPQPLKPAKLTNTSAIHLTVQYKSLQLNILNRYIEVEVIDDLQQFWIGNLFGFHVRGTGGQGNIRACRVLQIKGQTIIVEGFNQRSNQVWNKTKAIVDKTLNQNMNIE